MFAVVPSQIVFDPNTVKELGTGFTTIAPVGLEVTEGEHVPETTTSNDAPFSDNAGLVIESEEVVTLLYVALLFKLMPFLRHWYVKPTPVAVTLIVAEPVPAQNTGGVAG